MKETVRRIFRSTTTDLVVFVLIIISITLLAVELAAEDPTISFPADFLGQLLTFVFAIELTLRWWIAPSWFVAKYVSPVSPGRTGRAVAQKRNSDVVGE